MRSQGGSPIANDACVTCKPIVDADTGRAAPRCDGDRDPERGNEDRAHEGERSDGVEGLAARGLSQRRTLIGGGRDDAKSGGAFAERPPHIAVVPAN